jgi:hypothetical protein
MHGGVVVRWLLGSMSENQSVVVNGIAEMRHFYSRFVAARVRFPTGGGGGIGT